MRENRLLFLMVGAIVLLVVVALGVALSGAGAAYRADDSPSNVVHNYIMALQRGDYERAYGYLHPDLLRYPTDVAEFQSEVQLYSIDNRFRVLPDPHVTNNRAFIEVEQSYDYGGWFDPSFSSFYYDTFMVTLIKTEAGWKIRDSEELFADCWNGPNNYDYCN